MTYDLAMPLFSPRDLVLVADDESFSRFMTEELLERLGGPTVLSARSGEEAKSVLNCDVAGEVRLVLLDFNMPPPNGVEVLKAIRSSQLRVAPDVVVMMVTGADALGLVAATVALDADAFLAKPLSVAMLADQLRAIAAEPRRILPPSHYAGIDVGGLRSRRRNLGEDTAVTALPLTQLREGMVLAQDVLAPNGDLLVEAGRTVGVRMARLLRALKTAGVPLADVAVVAAS
ncbi:MAG: response regulator [Bacteroidales bacterium]